MQTPKVPPADQLRFRVEVSTRWSDEDNQNVLNNAVYLTLMEEARHAYFGQLGLLEGNHFPFVLAQKNVCFLNPGIGGHAVEVSLATRTLGTSSFTQAYRLRDVARDLPLCEAEALFVAWDNEARHKTALSDAFRAAVTAFEGL